MLPRPNRLASAPFERAFQNAQTIRHPLLVLRIFQRNDEKPIRAAFVVPKKQGKATARNRTRRRVRERFRLRNEHQNPALLGCDLIFMATPQTALATNVEFDEALENLLSRAARKIAGDGPKIPQKSEKPAIAAQLALAVIGFYQRFVSPFTPPSCRFHPTCSCYTHAAIERFGLARGTFMGATRLCRCHPWNAGGDDPIPENWDSWKRPVWWEKLTKFRGAHGALVMKSRSKV